MQVCVTGANGFIGRYLVNALSRQGHSIRVLTRRDGNSFAPGVEVVIGDLTDAACSLQYFLAGCEILFHCAGEIHDIRAMRPLHVDGTERLIKSVVKESSRSNRKIHWVQLSSVGAYGPPIGKIQINRVVTEKTPTRPVNEYELTKTLSDELVVAASKGDIFTYTILRPSNVFGSKTTNQSLRRLIELVKRGFFFYVGKPGAVTTYVHVDDVVGALIACAMDHRARGQVYNLSFDCTLEELIGYVATQLDVRTPRFRLPEPLINMVLGLLSAVLKRWMNLPTINVLKVRTRYPADKIINELGFEFSKPMPAGVADLTGEFK